MKKTARNIIEMEHIKKFCGEIRRVMEGRFTENLKKLFERYSSKAERYSSKAAKYIDLSKLYSKCRVSILIFVLSIFIIINILSFSSEKLLSENMFRNYNWMKIRKGHDYCKSSSKVLKSTHFNDKSPNYTIITNEELFNMKRYGWSSPIVVENYKLLFVQIEKVGSTQWKKLLQLIQNISSPANTSIHDPANNGLKYLTSYDDLQPRLMLLNSSWTKATMVREPRARILSAYLHVKSSGYFEKQLSLKTPTFRQFLFYISSHSNEHWSSQIRLPLWAYRNVMVGKLEDIQEFGEEVLRKIGAWDEWGHKWGEFQNETIFSEMYQGNAKSKAKANKKLRKYYTKELEDTVFSLYKDEYELFNYSCNYISLH